MINGQPSAANGPLPAAAAATTAAASWECPDAILHASTATNDVHAAARKQSN